ncbi:MAG: tetratricopeptide repeat protein [Candidatus Obscuribacterales bacterium]
MVSKRAVHSRESADKDFIKWRSRFQVATSAFEMGELKEARTLLFRLLEVAKTLDDNDFAIPASQLGIAIVSMEQGKLEESREYFDQGLSALSSSSDPACQELYAAGLRFFAIWHEKQDRLEEAERILRDSIERLKRLGNETAVQLAYSICDLCFVLIRQERMDEAEKLIESALDILKVTVGKDDPKYDWAKMLYKACLQQEEELKADAIEFLTQQLQWKAGPNHPNLVRAVTAYEAALHKRGMVERIETARERFTSILR